MKKIVITLGLALSLVVSAQANIYVSWGSGSGFYDLAGVGGLLGDGTPTATVQLIWSLDNIADQATMANANYVSGDDVFLTSITVSQGVHGDYADSLVYNTYNDFGATDLSGGTGYVYARIFQDATVDANDYYYWGPVVAASDLDPVGPPAATPQPYNMSRDSFGGLGDALHTGAFSDTVQPVPEPGTMALFAIGVATLAAARRRKVAKA